MGLFDQWPYTNFHELNLTWVLEMLKKFENELENFINLNTIKYADPIQWDITRQYEANTVVIDANTGIAYISTNPVPSGVAISNTDYWTEIFSLNLGMLNQNITLRDDGGNPLATFSSVTGDWLVWNDTLYKVTQNINVNESYIVGYNLTRYTVELFIADNLTTVLTIIGSLSDLSTTDKTSIVNAINELLTRILGLNTNIGSLANLNTTDKTSIVNAINELLTRLLGLNTNVGDLDDLNTTDKTSIVNAINELLTRLLGLNTNIGSLANLNTTDKTSIVNAINEVNSLRVVKKRIVSISDSYAAGRGSQIPWTTYFENIMGLTINDDFFSYYEGSLGMVNVGDGGHTALTLLQAHENDVTDHDTITDVLFIGGGNDMSHIADIASAVSNFCTYVKTTYPNAKIWFGYDYNQLTKNSATFNNYFDSIQTYYESSSASGALWMANLPYVMHNAGFFISDGVHPTSDGGKYLAKGIFNAICDGECDVIYRKSCSYSSVSNTLTNTVVMFIQNETAYLTGNVGIEAQTFNAGLNDIKIGSITSPLFVGCGVAALIPVPIPLSGNEIAYGFIYIYEGDVYLNLRLTASASISDVNVYLPTTTIPTLLI